MIEGKKILIAIEDEIPQVTYKSFPRMTVRQSQVALRLLRLKMRANDDRALAWGGEPYVEHLREIFWEKPNGQFFQASLGSMIRIVLSWERNPAREDVIMAINLLLESSKTNPKDFSNRYL